MAVAYDHPLDRKLVPETLRRMFVHSYAEPVDELEAFVDGGQKYWPLPVVQHLRGLAAERKVPMVDGCEIYSVWQLLTSPQVRGVRGAIRNRALMMALEMQPAFPTAGEPGGPTVQDDEVKEAVTNIYSTYINGGMNAVVMGEGNTQNVDPREVDAPLKPINLLR